MPPLGSQVFIPPSLQSAAILSSIEQMAAQEGRTTAFIADKATDALVAAPVADICIYQEVDFAALSGRADNWTLAVPDAVDSCVALYNSLHPDLPVSWALTHGSAGVAAVHWLLNGGANILRFASDSKGTAISSAVQEASDTLESLYNPWPVPVGKTWDWRAPLIATSDNYRLNTDGWLELSGRARHLLAGPFIYLPAGVWSLVLVIEVDVETGVPRLAFQWGGAALDKTVFSTLIRKSGRYQIRLDAVFDRPDAAHCIIATDAAQIQGYLKLGDVKLSYISPLGSQASQPRVESVSA